MIIKRMHEYYMLQKSELVHSGVETREPFLYEGDIRNFTQLRQIQTIPSIWFD